MKGKFITLYGINNIGKTTQSKLLVKRLEKEGYKAKYVKYPVYDVHPSGDYINSVLRSDGQKITEEELQLWFVVNRYQFEPTLKRWLEEGYIVIAEDYRGTGIAWGMAKGLDEDWIEMINSKVLPEDFAIMLEGERKMSAKEDVHVHEQNDELAAKSMAIHNHLADKYGWKRVKVVRGIEITGENLWKTVREYLEN